MNKPTGCILILFLSSTFKSLQVETMLLTCSRHCMHAYRKLMYRSNRSFNIPPGQPPGHWTFSKIIVQILPYLGQNAVQIPRTRVHTGDQMPPPRGHFTGT